MTMSSSTAYMRDAKVPLSDDDREMENSWRCIPVPPTDDDDWTIVDASKDYKTGWRRKRRRPSACFCRCARS
jgi:hypothetical protein